MDTAAPSEELAELASRHGVATDYWDWQGKHVLVSADAIRAVLEALGVDAADDDAVRASLAAHDDLPWRRTLPATVVAREGWTPWVPVHVPHGARGPAGHRARGRHDPPGHAGGVVGAAALDRRSRGRRGDVRAAGRPAPGLAPAARPRRRRDARGPDVDVVPRRDARPPGAPAGAARRARVGPDGAGLPGALRGLVGHR